MMYEWMASRPGATWQKQPTPPRGSAACTLSGSSGPAQRWKGFGGCFNELGWKALQRLDAATRDHVLRDLFATDGGCGFNYCRLPIGANDYAESWYSHHEQPGDFDLRHFSVARDEQGLIPYLEAARRYQPGLFLFASPWSPPAWMKQPPVYNHGVLIWTPEYLTAYARYFVRFVQEYARRGIRIDAVHVQNEPNSDQKFPSCVWTGEKMRDFIRDYLGPMFQREQLDCQIWVGTLERAEVRSWAHLILSDERARPFVAGVGYQWAGKGAVQRTRMAWPEVPLIQTESECGDGQNSWEYAHYVFHLIHHYLTQGVEAYAYWNMVLPAGGESTWGWKQNAMISVDMERGTCTWNPEFYVMKHVAACVPPGSQMLRLAGRWSGHALAFRRVDGRDVYLLHNPYDTTVEVALGGRAGSHRFALAPQSFHTIVADSAE